MIVCYILGIMFSTNEILDAYEKNDWISLRIWSFALILAVALLVEEI